MKKVAIIGAGMAGLTIATYLQKQNFDVTIFDKGRGVGGRMSSRRTDWGYLDHGTQYFRIQHPDFQKFTEKYQKIIQSWQGNFATWIEGKLIPDDDTEIKYVPLTSMNNLCKAIAEGLTIHLQTRITKLEKAQNWTLIAENRQEYQNFDLVIITAPPAQTADLLASHTPITAEIKQIEMLPCFSLMLIPEKSVTLPYDGIKFEHPILGWLSVNGSKPERENNSGLIIQSNFSWATANLETDKEEITNILVKTVNELFALKLDSFKYKSVHLWRYALPSKSHQQGYFYDDKNQLAVCGDWCLSGKVESAFLSAYSLSLAIEKAS